MDRSIYMLTFIVWCCVYYNPLKNLIWVNKLQLIPQIQILSQLEHPCIISMIAVCMRPQAMLLLEYAELGSLNSFHPYRNMNRSLKHRIALQVNYI